MNKTEQERMYRYVIDRFEDNGWAVLEREDGERFDVPRFWLPFGAKEGDVLRLIMSLPADDLQTDPNISSLVFRIDTEQIQRRRDKVHSVKARLLKGRAES